MVDTSLAPYFDDYNAGKNFHKVLFTPGRAVQVRELNQLQTILQKQVERVGSHLFENGSMVIPGEVNFDTNYEYITLTDVNYDQIVDIILTNSVKVIGSTSGIVANLVQHTGNTIDDPITFFIQYESGSGDDDVRFIDGESVLLRNSVGTDFASATIVGSGQGSIFNVKAGIYFINGNFIQTKDQSIILSKYTQTPSVITGFRLKESVTTWIQDSTLADNASGSTNLNAVGADRLKLELTLEVHDVNDAFDRSNFIQLAKFIDGVLQQKVRGPDYSVIEETLARRTYDESGDYTVNAFGLNVREHLNTGTNDGVYLSEDGGDETKFVVGVEPGKAYVRGYEVENIVTEQIEVAKARDTGSINNSSFTLPIGNYIKVDTMNIIPKQSSFQKVTFYSGIPASPGAVPAGTVLGTARVRHIETGLSSSNVYVFDVKNASGVKDTSFIPNAKSIYAAGTPALTANVISELIDSVNYSLVFKLPVDNVKSLLNVGVSDTTYSVSRQYEVTADTGGTVILTAGTNEVFATPTNANSGGSYTNGATHYHVEIAPIASLGGIPVGKSMTISFGANASSKVVTVNVEVIKQTAIQKSKTPTTSSIVKTAGSIVGRSFFLGKSDVYKITSITENGVDKTDSYVLRKNITPEYYDNSYVELKASEPLPTNSVTINFEYFIHGSGDFFSVDSYSSIAYKDIPTEVINGVTVNMSDVIDFRSRYNDARTEFTGTGGSFIETPMPYSLLRCDIINYLPRVDKVYVTAKGEFGVIKGVSATNPSEPATPNNAMVIYKINVPAYTKNVKDIGIVAINNRRYTMRDIGKLEQRIENIEYYTTLNMLETETNGLQIVDPNTGLNRFKNGFVTDNFVDHSVGSYTLSEYKCSVSKEEATLRPEFYSEIVDFGYSSGISSNVVKNGPLITLPFTESLYMSQDLASDYINVNPYAVYLWNGDVSLTPNSDTWFDTVYTAPEVNYSVFNNGVLTQQWNSWEVNWTGGSNTSSVSKVVAKNTVGVFTTKTVTVVNQTDDRVVDTSVIPFMRSRDVKFSAKGLLPTSRVYAIFDDVNVSAHCAQDGKSKGQAMFTDVDGNISGTFTIPNEPGMRFRTGTKQFTLIDNPDNNKPLSISYGDASYSAQGTLITRTQSIAATRNITTSVRYYDPLAQSFLVAKNGGVFLTSVELYFASKDEVVPVSLEIRNMVNGYPGQDVVPYSSVVLNPSQVNVSTTAATATKFTFEAPVYLLEGQEYCFVVMTNSNKYNAYIGTMGNKVIGSTAYISKQPFVGVMFKSQNNSTWTADQTSDMKFKMNIAKFQTNVNGVAGFTNEVPNSITLANNPLVSASGTKNITVTCPNHNLFVGSTVSVSGVATAPGIPVGEINKVQTVTEVIDADTFKFAVATTNANASGSFGGATVKCGRNIGMNTIHPVIQEMLFENTNVDWTFTGTTGKSLDGTESPYLSSGTVIVEPNANLDLAVPNVVLNADNAATSIAGAKSATLSANMVTYSDNISPVIDVNRVGLVGVVNRINNPASLSETAATGGNAIARYITRVIGLKNAAESLKVFVDVNKPQGSNVQLYYRVGNTEEEVTGKVWTLMPSIVSIVATDAYTFNEFEYAADNLPLFSLYQFKAVLVSDSSTRVPKLKRFRGIALGS
jgi:hypothetical protein